MGRDGVVAEGLLVVSGCGWSRSNIKRSLQVSFTKNDQNGRSQAQSGTARRRAAQQEQHEQHEQQQ